MNWPTLFSFMQNILEQPLFTIKDTPVTFSSLAAFCLVMILFLLLARALNRLLSEWLLKRFQLDAGTRYTLTRLTHYTVIILGCVIAFQFIGIDLSGLAFIFGLLSVGIGFGLQNLTSNFVAGLILLFERPIKVGDRVTIGDTEGDVVEINMRSTTILSLRNISIIVPNSEFISSTVINWSHGDPRITVPIDVGVSYDSDLDTVIRCLQEVADEHPDVLKTPPPSVAHRGFGDSAWDMRLSVWVDNPKIHYQVRSDLHRAIVHKFREHQIEIPYPQRDLHLRSSIPLPVGSPER